MPQIDRSRGVGTECQFSLSEKRRKRQGLDSDCSKTPGHAGDTTVRWSGLMQIAENNLHIDG
jgi:hypothetical protein